MKTLMRLVLIGIVLAVVVIAAMVWVPVQYTPAQALTEPASTITAARGEYVMRTANCMACHTADDGQPFAGGRKIESPLGIIYSTNITPDKDTGIGCAGDVPVLYARSAGRE